MLSRFTPTVPGYATCRLIDNDVNKIDAMDAIRTSIATTAVTKEREEEEEEGVQGQVRGQGQQQPKRTNKKPVFK